MRRCAHECVCWAMVEYGDAECPGLCDAYAPMPDVGALLKLADEMTVEKGDIWGWSSRIREALGVSDDA